MATLTSVPDPSQPHRAPEPARELATGGSRSLTIGNAVVKLLRDHAGRGPTKAKAVISNDLVVVTLRDCLTAAEKTLARGGEGGLVKQTRDALHQGLRSEATEVVEDVTGKRVIAFLADQHQDPDIGVIAFVLAPRET